jgi:hypothetical protein
MKSPAFIYIAGPYRGGEHNSDHMSNCHRAMEAWDYFWQNKVCAICPHWSFAQQLVLPREDTDWLAYTMSQMTLCKAVYRMEGVSYGSDAEVAAAKQLGIPVFHDINKAVSYMRVKYGPSTCGEGDCGDCSQVGCCPGGQSQISSASGHNAPACVWRLTDCSSGRCPTGVHDSDDGRG